MAATYIPLHEAATMLPELGRRARSGETIMLEDGMNSPLALSPTAGSAGGLLNEEQLRLGLKLKTHAAYEHLHDETFADDLDEIIALRDLPSRDPWTDS